PANSIVGSVPGSPITPEVAHISATPAYPMLPITLVARVTSGPVRDARRTGKSPSVPGTGRAPSARLVFPHARGGCAVRYRDPAGPAARDAPAARPGGTRRRQLHPRTRGARLRAGARGVPGDPPRDRSGERNGRDHDRAARARG